MLQFDADAESVRELLVPVPDRDLRHARDLGDLALRPPLVAQDRGDVDRCCGDARGPTGVAAAAIYISSILSNERRTQREVAEVAGVTEVTIRNRYKELTERLEIRIEL